MHAEEPSFAKLEAELEYINHKPKGPILLADFFSELSPPLSVVVDVVGYKGHMHCNRSQKC